MADESINWQSFLDIESRMVDNQSTANSNDLLQKRLQHVQAESTPSDCHQDLMSVDEIKAFIQSQDSAPFNDIPNLPQLDYSDSELELWSAMIAEYRQVVEKVPKYASIMIWSGIPPALRGKAWISMCEGHSQTFESLYDSLAQEWTPFVKIIGRDLNRTFPEIGLFQEKGGEGQMKLGRVLRAYSAYDMQVGYCQGLTFLAGPLLLHMSDKEAFCVLIKLMEDYDVRSIFTADMSGLQLRMYQFDSLLTTCLPQLSEHFENLGVNSIYASQWFLSFFAVTCPLSMLVRIYDLMFAEGVVPTLMRVAIAVLQRNQKMLLLFDDEEQVLQHLLGRQLWDVYGLDADLLVSDITSISHDTLGCLDQLEKDYDASRAEISRAKSKHRSRKSIHRKNGDNSKGFLASRFSFWSSASSPSVNLTRSDSKVSIESVSGSESDFTCQQSGPTSSASSFTSIEESKETQDVKLEYEKQIQQLQAQLERTRLALDSERRARQADKESVEAMMAQVSEEFSDNAKLNATCADVKARFGITDGTNVCTANALACTSCDRYLQELAAVKTSEAIVRQELDEMSDKCSRLQEVSSSVNSSSPSKGWGLWK